jgi:hypothetical protein
MEGDTMNTVRLAARVLLTAACLLASPAYATSFSTDQSDLYYIASESGWGVQLVQRGPDIFATLFIYGPTGQPTWYTATMYPSGTSFTWSGTLIATTGTYFGAPWNPAAVTINSVGTMTWTAPFVDSGTLTYVVNGVTVVKSVTRQSLVLDDYSGHYAGGIHRDYTGCVNPALDVTSEVSASMNIAQNGAAVSIQTSEPNGTCSYTGTLSEAGQMGSAQLSFTCTDGTAGTGSLDQMQVSVYAIGGSLAATYTNPPGCQATGWFGGSRQTGL